MKRVAKWILFSNLIQAFFSCCVFLSLCNISTSLLSGIYNLCHSDFFMLKRTVNVFVLKCDGWRASLGKSDEWCHPLSTVGLTVWDQRFSQWSLNWFIINLNQELSKLIYFPQHYQNIPTDWSECELGQSECKGEIAVRQCTWDFVWKQKGGKRFSC